MTFIVLFEDNPAADPAIRKTHMEAHLSFLEDNGAILDAAGALSTVAGEPGGGLWIVSCDDTQQVEDLIHRDPFWPTGLRKSYRILKWRQVYAQGQRRV